MARAEQVDQHLDPVCTPAFLANDLAMTSPPRSAETQIKGLRPNIAASGLRIRLAGHNKCGN
jgi:hypothetical protein